MCEAWSKGANLSQSRLTSLAAAAAPTALRGRCFSGRGMKETRQGHALTSCQASSPQAACTRSCRAGSWSHPTRSGLVLSSRHFQCARLRGDEVADCWEHAKSKSMDPPPRRTPVQGSFLAVPPAH